MADTAVLIIDMMNAYRQPDADKLAPNVADIIDPLGRLVARAHEHADVDVVYVNDKLWRLQRPAQRHRAERTRRGTSRLGEAACG